MTVDFAHLSLRWRPAQGAQLPGFRAAEARADTELPTSNASSNVAQADSLMQAIAAGATEDELVVLAAGALTTLYHLLAQLTARRLLEVSVELDGKVLCRLLPRSRDFHPPGEIDLPGRVVLDRFAYLRAGRRGAILQSPDADCDILAESETFSALIARLAAGPIEPNDLQRHEQRSLLALLVALGFAGDADAVESPSRRVWEFHDRLFHAASQLHDDGVARGATHRFRDHLAPLPVIRPRHPGNEITLPDLGPAIESRWTLLQVMKARRSCRDLEQTDLTIAELGEVLGRVGHLAMRRHDDGKEFLTRPIPSAGGLQALEFYVATNGCAGLPAGFFHYRGDIHGLTHLADGDAAANVMLQHCAQAWDRPDQPPSMLVVLAARLPRIAWKYEGIAYRLALLDAGVALQSLYLVTTDLGLAGAAVGASDPELFAQASGMESWEETCVAAFGFGRPRVS